ncbi:hypothetical protein NP233_g650 [Leucocoprinus birnbaumii]|uniref:FAS1 domain-containing protein n=1 Tax=Leucocoprinus birnbaumii TaxID=56174 RepID=A0AAD5W3T1_9AGAR|nr:hypothetical protein NP233_g650 [Leucocoprinus birnbaumii]
MKLQHLSVLLFPFLPFVSASSREQIIMDSIREPFVPKTHAQPTLSDLLTVEQSASIFFSYARELELSKLLDDENSRTTLFVPTNKAVMALERKPHQGQGSYAIADDVEITEEEYETMSKENVERWVSVHIIPEYPISLEDEHQTMLDGKSISFKPISKGDTQKPEWTRVTLDDGARITKMKEASNGVLYLIDTAISPE